MKGFAGCRGEVKNRGILDENGAFLRQSAGFCPVCRGFWGDGGRRAPKSGARARAEVQKALFSHHKSLSGAKFRKSTLGLSEKKYYLCPTDARASQTQGSVAGSERTARSSPFMVTDHAPPPCAHGQQRLPAWHAGSGGTFRPQGHHNITIITP